MKIIDINEYIKRRENTKMFNELIEELKKKGEENKEYSIDDVIIIARKILLIATYYTGVTTPINRILEDFGIHTYHTSQLSKDISGVIYVGGTTKQIYSYDKIILVDSNDPIKHQRFVAAHELAHYLFDCLSNKKYSDGRLLFCETYPKVNHSSKKEVLADRFAAELLMPSNLFIEQYNIAMEENNSRAYIIKYLSEYFQTKMSSIEKRIIEVLQ